MALVGLQGRGLAEVVQAPCCHSFLLNTLIFQRPFEGHYTSGTPWEPKTLESNKSEIKYCKVSTSGVYRERHAWWLASPEKPSTRMASIRRGQGPRPPSPGRPSRALWPRPPAGSGRACSPHCRLLPYNTLLKTGSQRAWHENKRVPHRATGPLARYESVPWPHSQYNDSPAGGHPRDERAF